jgi:hypothetical protein
MASELRHGKGAEAVPRSRWRVCDFGALLEMEAKAAGLQLRTENRAIDDGLSGDN